MLARALVDAGVRVVFTPGGAELAAALAGGGDPTIRQVPTVSVHGAVAAADGWARRTGRLGVALLPRGAGALAGVAAVEEAWASGSPLLLLASDVPARTGRSRRFSGVLDETADLAAPFAPRTKAVHRVSSAATLEATVAAAATAALQPPCRPVMVQLPADLLTAAVHDQPEDADAVDAPPEPPRIEHVQLRRAGNLVDASQRVLLWAGGGALRSGAGVALAELAEKVGAPVITTTSSAGILPARHPCLVGLPPHLPEVGTLWDDADLVIAIGTDFDGPATQEWAQPPPRALIAVNVDAGDAGKNYQPDVLLRGDAATLTKALANTVSYRGGTAVVRSRLDDIRTRVWARLTEDEPTAAGFVRAFDAAVGDRTVVAVDPGHAGQWLAGFREWTLPRTLLHPAGHSATRGWAVRAALGAATEGHDPVVAVTDAQGLLAAAADLPAVATHGGQVTILVVDDRGDTASPDLLAVARSLGLAADAVADLADGLTAGVEAGVADVERARVVLARGRLPEPPTAAGRWYRRQHD